MENEQKHVTADTAPVKQGPGNKWPEDEVAEKYIKEAGKIEDVPTADEQAEAEEQLKSRK
jgi:hypothetical protein